MSINLVRVSAENINLPSNLSRACLLLFGLCVVKLKYCGTRFCLRKATVSRSLEWGHMTTLNQSKVSQLTIGLLGQISV